MRTVEEALAEILRAVQPLPTIRIPLLETPGRVLAEDIESDIPVPPFDNSGVDGYAVRAADTRQASADKPVYLRIAGEITAGQTAHSPVLPGSAIRIMTGAPVPPQADAVVMVEDTFLAEKGQIAILEAAQPEQHIRRSGEDVERGTLVLAAGTRIRPAEVAMLATMGRSEVAVVRAPRVAVFSTGDEVIEIEAGVLPPPGKIRDSNRYALAALVREAGGELHSLRHIPDDPEATEAAFRTCVFPESGEGADVIVTAGGVSVGDRDFVKPALEKLGTLDLWKVAMKPGKPLAFGSIGKTLFFGLPGNPVSVMVTFELFARPALWKMAGRSEKDLSRRQVPAKITTAISHASGRREYVRAMTEVQNGEFVSTPTGKQGSGILRSLTLANSLIILPTESTGVSEGAVVEVLLLD